MNTGVLSVGNSVWMVLNGLFHGRFMFYLLFGVSLGYAYRGIESVDIRKYSMRALVFILFGLFNYFVLLWRFDILISFGICSLLAGWFISRSWRVVLAGSVGVGILYYGVAHFGLVSVMEAMKASTDPDTMVRWSQMLEGVEEVEAAKSALYSQGYLAVFLDQAHGFKDRMVSLLFFEIWEGLTLILLGLGLFKLGFLELDKRIFGLLGLVGCIAGPIWCVGLHYDYWNSGFEFVLYEFKFSSWQYFVGRILLMTAYGGVILYLCRSGVLTKFTGMLAICGRYALSNYLFQTMMFMVIFILFRQHGSYGVAQMYFWVCLVAMMIAVMNYCLYKSGKAGPAERLFRAFYETK